MKKQTILFVALLSIWLPELSGQTPAGKLSALTFGDLYYTAQSDTAFSSLKNAATGGKKGETGLSFRRIFLTYDAKIASRFDARIRLEANDKTTSNGLMTVFIKDISLKYNYFRKQYLQFGIIPPPAFDVSENRWGHRYLEKTIMDLRSIVSTRDVGISLRGNIDTAGIVKYCIMVGDNTGTKPVVDSYKRVYGHLEFNPLKQLTITLYGDKCEKKSIADPYDTLGPNLSATESTLAFFIGYVLFENLNLGVESYLSFARNGYDSGVTLKDRRGYGITVYGSYSLNKNVELVARYDYFNPNTNENAVGDIRNMVLAGMTYTFNPNFVLSPNVILESYESSSTGRDYSPSITPRITFYFRF